MTNYSAPQPATGEDPGKTLGIVGLVLAFLAPLIGLIVSIIGRSKSKQAGFQNNLAKWGIIVSIIVMVLYIVFGVVIFASSMALVGEMQTY